MGRSSDGPFERAADGRVERTPRTATVLSVGIGTSVTGELESALDDVEVISAPTVDTAIETLDSELVDCVATATDVDQADGVELVETVRDHHPQLPVVLVASGSSGQVAGDVINAGVDSYVSLAEDGIIGLAERIEETMARYHDSVQPGQVDGIEQAVEHAADAIFVTDSDGRIEYVNSAFEELTGYNRSEAVGQNPRILNSGVQSEPYFERLWETILDGEVWEEKVVNSAKSGDRYVAHQTITPVTDADGTVERFVAIQRDVTAHRLFESQLEAARATLSQLYDTSFDADAPLQTKLQRALEIGTEHLDHPVGYVTRIEDDTQKIIAAVGSNDAIEVGAKDPVKQTYCRKTIEQEEPFVIGDAESEGWACDPAFQHFGLQRYIGAEIRIDGTVYGTVCFGGEEPRDKRLLEIQQSTVKTLAGWVGYEIDRSRYERTLERKNERLEKFASVISHDLRNPLHVAQARLELARETGDDEHFEPVVRAHERMEDIIEDTLTLAREGELVSEVSAVSLEAIATDCWENVATGGATLAIADDVELEADPDKLRHILENLFRNSVEHGSDDTDTVTVTLGGTADGFYVADNGTGIPPEEREQVFEQGYSNGDGTGFGLAIVETVAQAHGWSVAVTESQAGGARFEFDVDGEDAHSHLARQ